MIEETTFCGLDVTGDPDRSDVLPLEDKSCETCLRLATAAGSPVGEWVKIESWHAVEKKEA
jgi:hypothetical protein